MLYLDFEPYNAYLQNINNFEIYYPFVIQLFTQKQIILWNDVINTEYEQCIDELTKVYNESQKNYCTFLQSIKKILLNTTINQQKKNQLMKINIQPNLITIDNNCCLLDYLIEMKENMDQSDNSILKFYDTINYFLPHNEKTIFENLGLL